MQTSVYSSVTIPRSIKANSNNRLTSNSVCTFSDNPVTQDIHGKKSTHNSSQTSQTKDSYIGWIGGMPTIQNSAQSARLSVYKLFTSVGWCLMALSTQPRSYRAFNF